jgi:hypothetical protein
MKYGKAGIRKDSWTHRQDSILAETVMREQGSGLGVMAATAMAAPLGGRSQISCYTRWSEIKDRHWSFSEEAASRMSTPQEDMVNQPPHYTAGGIETIDYLQAKLSQEEFTGYCRGNVLKYISRCGLKGEGVEDLKKARWYLDRLIGRLEAVKPDD